MTPQEKAKSFLDYAYNRTMKAKEDYGTSSEHREMLQVIALARHSLELADGYQDLCNLTPALDDLGPPKDILDFQATCNNLPKETT